MTNMTAFSTYITFTSGYLILCYVVGAKLTRFQAVAISLLYLFAASMCTVSAIGQQQAIAEIRKNSRTALDGLILWDMDSWNIVMALLMGLGALMSLYFMYHSRTRAGT